MPDFIPSSTWQGSKAGYYFGTTAERGTGYYEDSTTAAGGGARKQKHRQEDGDASPHQKRAKRSVNFAEDRNETKTIPSREALLLEQAEQEAAAHGDGARILDLTARGVRAASAGLAKAVEKNELQRAEYADQPDQYMESEVSLYEHIAPLKAIAADPAKLYPVVLNDTELLPTLTQLLMHENEDIASSVVSVLLEWLDSSLLLVGEEGGSAAGTVVAPVVQVAAAVLKDASELLVGNLARIKGSRDDAKSGGDDEDDDEVGKGTDDILSLFENLLEMDMMLQEESSEETVRLVPDGASVAAKLCKDTTLVAWLFQQIEADKEQEKYRDRSLELLAYLAPREDVYTVLPDWSKIPVFRSALVEEDDDGNSKKAVSNGSDKKGKTPRTVDGIEILLQAVATYRKKQPEDDPQVESLENACMIMASALTFSAENVLAFLDAQGIELTVRCLKERVHAGGVALKWLDFAGSDRVHRQACEHVVGSGALKYLFPLFMGRSLPKPAPAAVSGNGKKLKKEWAHSIEETTIRILYALTRHLRDDSPNDAKERLLAKFLDHDKCDRLVELCLFYDKKARTAEYKFYRSDVEETLQRSDDDAVLQLAALEAKLSGGGDLFHRVCALAAFCCVGSKRCHERILSQLRLQNSGIGLIREALEEFIANLGEGVQEEQLRSYLDRI